MEPYRPTSVSKRNVEVEGCMFRVSCTNLVRPLLCSFLFFTTGCELFTTRPDCINENRNVSAEAHLVDGTSATTDTGCAVISLADERNYRTKRTVSRGVIYFASSTMPRTSVTAVHIHAAAANDALLYVFPLTPVGPEFVITQSFTNAEFSAAGATTFDVLFARVAAGQAYVDVHTGQPTARLRGVLVNKFPGNDGWVHAYCS